MFGDKISCQANLWICGLPVSVGSICLLESLTNSRGSRVAGRGSNVAVAGPMSRSPVQSRGRGSKVAAGENDLNTTDMKTI